MITRLGELGVLSLDERFLKFAATLYKSRHRAFVTPKPPECSEDSTRPTALARLACRGESATPPSSSQPSTGPLEAPRQVYRMTKTSLDFAFSARTAEPVPTTVQRAIIAVCRDAFHYRDDVRAVFILTGVPRALYEKHDDPTAYSKAKIARAVLNELTDMGERGYAIQRKIVEELCRMTRPHPDAPDQKAGAAALNDLKREAQAALILIDPEQAAANARRAAHQRRAIAIQERQTRLGTLRDEFHALSVKSPRTNAERQERGYKLERLLADLFRLHDLEYRPSYRTEGEQIDGSFHFRGFTYLVEAKWRASRPTAGDLLEFKAKVDSKIDSTRGIYISMAGFEEGALDHAFHIARDTRNNVILVNGQDIALIFEGQFGLIDALITKIDAAEQEGKMWQPLY